MSQQDDLLQRSELINGILYPKEKMMNHMLVEETYYLDNWRTSLAQNIVAGNIQENLEQYEKWLKNKISEKITDIEKGKKYFDFIMKRLDLEIETQKIAKELV